MTKAFYKTPGFRRNDSKPPYFEGYYFKFINAKNEIVIIIAGVSISKNEKYSFIQVASNYHDEVDLFKFPLNKLKISKDDFHFEIGDNQFNRKKIVLNLENVKGEFNLKNNVNWSRSLFNPNIMGLLSYIPRVECKHDVITISADVSGAIVMKNKALIFENGDGYIEKNWGNSFPKKYMWIHANQFKTKDLSLQFAIAHPKWIFFRPQVYIGYIMNRKPIHFGTHRLSLIKIIRQDDFTSIRISKLKYQITIKIKNKAPIDLIGPKNGNLNNKICEYLNSDIQLIIMKRHLFKENKELICDSSKLSTTETHNEINQL